MEYSWEALQPLKNSTKALEMNQGDHFWVWFGDFEPTSITNGARSLADTLDSQGNGLYSNIAMIHSSRLVMLFSKHELSEHDV